MVRILLAATGIAAVFGVGLGQAQAQGRAGAPAACPVKREYIIYFPAGKSEVTDDGKTVVQQAVGYGGAAARFAVTGHTDGVEAPILSMERTNAVSGVLTQSGVTNARIDINAAGGDQPAVPTTKAEPLNRRATITVTPSCAS